jgi:hypothetical protein
MNKYAGKFRYLIIVMILMMSGHIEADEYFHELQFSGGAQLAQGDANTGTAEGEIAYGYSLTQNWQVGIRQLLSYGLNDPAEDVWTGSTSGFVKYYFTSDDPDKRLQYFTGILLGLSYSDVDATGSSGPMAGFRYFISDETFLLMQYQYEYYFDKLDAGAETDDFNTGNHYITIGLGRRW